MPTLFLLFKTRSLYLTFKSILKVESCEDFKHFLPSEIHFSHFIQEKLENIPTTVWIKILTVSLSRRAQF